jgi:large subunit ribosomal protein L2
MALIKVKPTSPGRRAVVKVVNPDLHKGRPHAALVEKKSKKAGRNNLGRITTRHQGGGEKKHYRVVDFRRNKDGIPAKVERLEYDPNRSAHLALLCYADGERRYIVAAKGLSAGAQVISGAEAPIKLGNTLPLRNIPVGTTIHCVEMLPGKGAQLARAAGTSVQLLAREGTYAQLRLRSGEIRKVHVDCRATIGEVGNEENNLRSIGKAGAQRWRGIRPTVRGVAMNPVDHPHGGGEGKTGTKRDPVSPWGQFAKGYKTRKNKRTASMIVRSRHRA